MYLTERVEKTVTAGVLILKHLFSTIGFLLGPDNAVIIGKTGELQGEPVRYFQPVAVLDPKRMEWIQIQSVRYGIINNEYTWLALMKLQCKECNTWDGFQCPVDCLVSIPDISVLQQLARYVNDRHHKNAYNETPFFW